jgi:hypothetical protein
MQDRIGLKITALAVSVNAPREKQRKASYDLNNYYAGIRFR